MVMSQVSQCGFQGTATAMMATPQATTEPTIAAMMEEREMYLEAFATPK